MNADEFLELVEKRGPLYAVGSVYSGADHCPVIPASAEDPEWSEGCKFSESLQDAAPALAAAAIRLLQVDLGSEITDVELDALRAALPEELRP